MRWHTRWMCAGLTMWMLAAACARAQTTCTWTNTMSGVQNWSGANWSPSTPTNGGGADLFLFFGVNTGTYTANNDFSITPFVLNSLLIATGTVTLTGNTLCLTNNGTALPIVTNYSGKAAAINVDLILNTNTTFSAVNNLSLNGLVKGEGSITKTGVNTLTLTNANSYGGGTLVVTGALSVSHSLALGSGRVTVADGSYAKLQLNGGITVLNPLTVGSEKPGWSDNVNSVSGENVLGGLVTVKESNIRASAGSTLRITNGINGTAYLSFNSSGTIKVEAVPILLTNQAVYFGGGNPGIIQLNVGGNVFSTAYFWGGRLLALGVDNALPTGVTLAMQNGQTGGLNLNGFNQTIGSLNNGTNYLMITNSGSLARFTVNQSGSVVSSARLAGNLALVKTGAGSLTLTNSCSHSGGTVISNGTLRLALPNALPSSGAVDVSGGFYDLGGYTVTNGLVTISGGEVTNGMLCAANCVLAGPCSVWVPLVGNGRLTKSGPGTALLRSPMSYTGPTVVSGGTLRLQPLPVGTVAYYGFNDSSNIGKDGSPQSNALKTVTGSPQYSANGKFGGSLYLNGSSTMGTLSGAFPTGVPTGAAPYTVAAYIRAETNCNIRGGWLGYGSNNTSRCNNYRLEGSNYVTAYNYWWANDASATLPSGSFTDGWHSVVGTWDGATRQIYIDGVSRYSLSASGLDVGTNDFVVGKTTNDANFKGWIDDLLIANRALTATEIISLNTVGIRDCTLPSGTALQVATGAVLDLNNNSQTVASLSGSGGVTGGVLTVIKRLSAGEADGAIGSLTVSSGLTLAAGITNAVDCTALTFDMVRVQGALTLQGSGTVALSLADSQKPPREITLFTFSSLIGGPNLSAWTVTGVPNGYRARMTAQVDAIILNLGRVGTMVSVR